MNTQTRYFFPALGRLYEDFGQAGWAVFRVAFGLFFIPHGGRILFNWFGGSLQGVAQAAESIGLAPGVPWAYFIGGLEVIGGILLVLGLATRPVALLFFFYMFFGAFFFHARFGYFWTGGGMEVPLLLTILSVALLLRGGGEYSLDRRLGREV